MQRARPLYACIEREVARTPTLEGHLTVDVEIAGDGRVTNASAIETTFADDARLLACLAAAWPALRVEPPRNGATIVRVTLPWECGGARAPSTADGRGSMDKEMIRIVIRTHLDEVRACYEQQLAHDPSLTGRVMMQFTISSGGNVITSRVQSSTVANADVGTCIANTALGWRFPMPCGGGIVVVSYPFVLKTAGPP